MQQTTRCLLIRYRLLVETDDRAEEKNIKLRRVVSCIGVLQSLFIPKGCRLLSKCYPSICVYRIGCPVPGSFQEPAKWKPIECVRTCERGRAREWACAEGRLPANTRTLAWSGSVAGSLNGPHHRDRPGRCTHVNY